MPQMAVSIIFVLLLGGALPALAQGTETSTAALPVDPGGADSSEPDIFDEPFEIAPPPPPSAPPVKKAPPPPPPEVAPPPPPPVKKAPPPPRIRRVPPPPPPAAIEPLNEEAEITNLELYQAGEAERSTGRTLLISGVVGLVGGAALCTSGYIGLLSNLDAEDDSTPFGAMLLGGGIMLAAGSGLAIAGSLMLGQGGRKIQRAKKSVLLGIGPTFVDGKIQGAEAAFRF